MHIWDSIPVCDQKYFGLQHSLQLINLGCDSNNAIYELASVCEVTEDGQPVTVTFPPIKTETQVS
jgi:hypothetical protein